jgi:Sulfotransferase family
VSKVTFKLEEMLQEASQRAGLENFGNPRFREGLAVLLETMDDYVKGDNYRLQHRNTVLGRLVTRLEIQEAFRKHPEILEQEISKPIFVTGLPRSGTSALFNLLDSDPNSRGLLLWETAFPQPLEGLPEGAEDPRFRAMKEHMDANRNPEMDKIHYSGADVPEECCLLQVLSFDGVSTGWEYLQEPYHSWFKTHGLDFMYEEHRDHLKLLQWQRPGNRWLLKAPAHMWAVEEIVRVFPDACLVWGHREPVGVTASICSMTEKMVYGFNFGGVSEDELKMLGPRIMDWYATSLEKGLAAREHISPDRYFDYGFKDFIADPRATVQGIYDHLQLPMEEATRQAIEDHIARNAKGKHGKHEYDLQRYGLTEQQVRDRYKFYLDNNSLV